jgi:hypothetical protein
MQLETPDEWRARLNANPAFVPPYVDPAGAWSARSRSGADDAPCASRIWGVLFSIAGIVLLFIGVGAFGTASSGSATMFGLTMEASFACASPSLWTGRS